jgi:hypothetical protein
MYTHHHELIWPETYPGPGGHLLAGTTRIIQSGFNIFIIINLLSGLLLFNVIGAGSFTGGIFCFFGILFCWLCLRFFLGLRFFCLYDRGINLWKFFCLPRRPSIILNQG